MGAAGRRLASADARRPHIEEEMVIFIMK